MQGTHPSRADAPAALITAALFFAFGVFAILRPERLRTAMDNFAAAWNRCSWHPYRLSLPVLRVLVGAAGIGGGVLFVYIAYAALTR